jgi:hypothetical protein
MLSLRLPLHRVSTVRRSHGGIMRVPCRWDVSVSIQMHRVKNRTLAIHDNRRPYKCKDLSKQTAKIKVNQISTMPTMCSHWRLQWMQTETGKKRTCNCVQDPSLIWVGFHNDLPSITGMDVPSTTGPHFYTFGNCLFLDMAPCMDNATNKKIP